VQSEQGAATSLPWAIVKLIDEQQSIPHTPAVMVANSLSQRMRKLQTKLLSIRLGSGAYVLPKDIKRIHLRFAPKINGGHMGPR
jgi:hypothetical protein